MSEKYTALGKSFLFMEIPFQFGLWANTLDDAIWSRGQVCDGFVTPDYIT